MKISITARVAALITAAFVTFGTIDLIADYAYPPTPAVQLATAARCRNGIPTRPNNHRCSTSKLSRRRQRSWSALKQPLVTGGHWPKSAIGSARPRPVCLASLCAGPATSRVGTPAPRH
jgi:hypothetical protein